MTTPGERDDNAPADENSTGATAGRPDHPQEPVESGGTAPKRHRNLLCV